MILKSASGSIVKEFMDEDEMGVSVILGPKKQDDDYEEEDFDLDEDDLDDLDEKDAKDFEEDFEDTDDDKDFYEEPEFDDFDTFDEDDDEDLY